MSNIPTTRPNRQVVRKDVVVMIYDDDDDDESSFAFFLLSPRLFSLSLKSIFRVNDNAADVVSLAIHIFLMISSVVGIYHNPNSEEVEWHL